MSTVHDPVHSPADISGPLSPEVRLHIVTGKGGTGKTTVAAALALALATGGRRVLLTEVENRQGIAQLFDTAPLPYAERKVASAPGGGELYALAIDPEAALMDYLEMFYNLKRAGRMLDRMGVVDFATTIAPGLRDVLLTGKVKETVTRKVDGRPMYDAVVLDAPPTGRILQFLNVTQEVMGLAKVGPIRNQADSVRSLLHSPSTAVHLVTLLEEMPVQETLDGIAELQESEIPVGAVLINMVREPLLPPKALDAALHDGLDLDELAGGLRSAGIPVPRGAAESLVGALASEAADHARRVALESEQRHRLEALPLLHGVLPLMTDAVDMAGLYRLAAALRTQGLVA